MHINFKPTRSKNVRYFQTEQLKINDGAPQILSIQTAVYVEFTKIVDTNIKVPQEVKLQDIFN